jgi:hypothetical protein
MAISSPSDTVQNSSTAADMPLRRHDATKARFGCNTVGPFSLIQLEGIKHVAARDEDVLLTVQ